MPPRSSSTGRAEAIDPGERPSELGPARQGHPDVASSAASLFYFYDLSTSSCTSTCKLAGRAQDMPSNCPEKDK